jgi:hypothetical protein
VAGLIAPEFVVIALGIGIGFLEDAYGLLNSRANWPFLLVLLVPIILGITLFLWLGACLSVSVPAAALENSMGIKSLRRSWMLTKGARTRIWVTWLAIFVSLWVFAWGLEFLLSQFMYFIGVELQLAGEMRNLYGPAVFILVTAIYILLGPIYPIAITLIYYDQRVRLEGFDIERMMEEAGMNAPATTPAESKVVQA